MSAEQEGSPNELNEENLADMQAIVEGENNASSENSPEMTNEEFEAAAAAAAAALENNNNNNNNTNNNTNNSSSPGNNDGVSENSEEEGTPPEGDTSGVKIGEGSPQEQEDDEAEEDTTITIGQYVKINYNQSAEIAGRIYYISDTLIRIMPDGVSDRLVDFKLIDDAFDPDLNVSSVGLGEKIPQETFVAWQGFRVDQLLNAFDKNGVPVGTYKVISINEKEDKATLENVENGDQEECDFGSVGIPLDKPFQVLRVQPSIETEPSDEEIAKVEEQRFIASIPGAQEAIERGIAPEFDDIEEFEIEEAPAITIVEIEKSKQSYPELAQKSSMVADLSSFYDQVSLQNPTLRKKLGIFAQVISNLKNSVIARNPDGSVIGEAKLSAETMLDVVSNRNVPIVRPVLNTKRVLVSEYRGQTDKESNDGTILQRRFDDIVEKSVECMQTLAGIPPAEPGIGLPRWYQMLNQYFTKYPVGDEFSSSGYTVQQDSDYFRHAAPGLENVAGLIQSKKIPDVNPGHGKYELDAYIKENVGISIRRARGPTYYALPKGGIALSREGDRAEVKGYTLFPYKVILDGALGASRTGTLWEDLLRSGTERTLMSIVLKKYGGIVNEDLDAQKINYLDVTASTAVRIEFNEYLKLLLKSLAPRGLGDTHSLKVDLGIEEYEFTSEQQSIIERRVQEVIASVRNLIKKLRETPISTEAEARPLQGDEFLNSLEAKVSMHPELVKFIKSMQKELPGYKNIDIAVFSYLFVHAQDYLLAALGGNSKNLEREQDRFVRDMLLDAMHKYNRKAKLVRETGLPPKPNPCTHTKELVMVRKAPTDTERIVLLSKFLNVYRGGREDNWITCKQCKQHLICHHEVLQIQQYLYPREKSGIQKEIILNYAGGTFDRHHICRNCGLPIADLDFDTGLEYDDEGRPMNGRAVIVDKDEVVKEQIELLLGTKIMEPDEIKFNTAKKNEYYAIAKVICDYMGFPIGLDALTNCIERAEAYDTTNIMSAEKYKAQKSEKKLPPYARYAAFLKISLMLALLFIEIQSARVDYRISYVITGCRPSIEGFPRKNIQDEPTPENSPGIYYVACAMARMPFRAEFPWSDGFATITSLENRQNELFKQIKTRIQRLLATDTQLAEKLTEKRKYIEQVVGYSLDGGREGEKIPAGFLPRMEQAEKAAENAASSPAVAEGAKKTPEAEAQQADAWLRTANKYARESAIIIRGSPYAESSCCYSQITNPTEFWESKTFPPLPHKHTKDLYFRRKSLLFPIYETRPLQEQVFKLSPEDYYKVFLEICWKGPRIGLAHEFGYDYKCDWCSLQIPVDFLFPEIFEENPDWSKKKRQEKRDEQAQYEQNRIVNLKARLQGDGVPFEDETAFRALIDAANSRRMFTAYRTLPLVPFETIEALQKIEIPPTESFYDDFAAAIENLKKLDVDSNLDLVLQALEPLTNTVSQHAEYILEGLNPLRAKEQIKILESITKHLSPFDMIEVIRSYLLIPALRITEDGYEVEERTKLPSIYVKGKTKSRLHDEHIKLITQQLQFHVKYIAEFKDEISKNFFAQIKLQNFIDQLDSFLFLTDELKISRLQFDDKPISEIHKKLLSAILQTVIFGTLGTLLNPLDKPVVVGLDEPTEDATETIKLLGNYVGALLTQYSTEKISYNSEFVKQIIAQEKEIELQGVIGRFNKMTDEQRDIERLKQNLKLGRFDIGTKAFKYDSDFWELQRQERMANHSALEIGADGEVVGGMQVDAFGDEIGGAIEEGYEIDFHPEDNE
jgi:hypothetical protein